jgi:hypothetical protein
MICARRHGGAGALAVAVLAMVACATAFICWWHTREAAAGNAPTVVVSGDTAGMMVAAGCTANQSGGLARRGTYLAELRKHGEVIYLDAGGAAGGTSLYQKVKFEAILEGERAMGINAHNLGKAELALGAEYLREVQGRLHFPFVSENVRDAGGKRIIEDRRIVEAGGMRVGVIGVVSALYGASGFTIDDPRQAVLDAANAMKGQCNVIVVLASMPQQELAGLALNLPEIDAVIGESGAQAIAPKAVGATMLASASRKGESLVELRVPAGRSQGAWEGKLVELTPAIADDSAQLTNVRRYLSMLEERDFSEQQSDVAVLPELFSSNWRIAGSAACLKCHATEYNSWIGSKHARAFATLQEKGFHVDSQCQRCHTTGFGIGGGFVSARQSGTSELAGVGCESCHGPSAHHVKDSKRQTSYRPAFDQCASCHNKENSPEYSAPVYWEAIKHGKSSGAGIGRR